MTLRKTDQPVGLFQGIFQETNDRKLNAKKIFQEGLLEEAKGCLTLLKELTRVLQIEFKQIELESYIHKIETQNADQIEQKEAKELTRFISNTRATIREKLSVVQEELSRQERTLRSFKLIEESEAEFRRKVEHASSQYTPLFMAAEKLGQKEGAPLELKSAIGTYMIAFNQSKVALEGLIFLKTADDVLKNHQKTIIESVNYLSFDDVTKIAKDKKSTEGLAANKLLKLFKIFIPSEKLDNELKLSERQFEINDRKYFRNNPVTETEFKLRSKHETVYTLLVDFKRDDIREPLEKMLNRTFLSVLSSETKKGDVIDEKKLKVIVKKTSRLLTRIQQELNELRKLEIQNFKELEQQLGTSLFRHVSAINLLLNNPDLIQNTKQLLVHKSQLKEGINKLNRVINSYSPNEVLLAPLVSLRNYLSQRVEEFEKIFLQSGIFPVVFHGTRSDLEFIEDEKEQKSQTKLEAEEHKVQTISASNHPKQGFFDHVPPPLGESEAQQKLSIKKR